MKLTGGFTKSCYYTNEKFDAEILNSTPNQVVQDSYDRCKPEEILVGIPTWVQTKRFDMFERKIIIRPVLVSELDRLGYNNSNSYISFLGKRFNWNAWKFSF